MSNLSNGLAKSHGAGMENICAEARIINNTGSPEARTFSVPLDAVTWTGGFWGERYDKPHTVTVRRLWEALADPDRGHVLDNFRIAAGYKQGEHQGKNWQDAWLYKWIEAASCLFRTTGDTWLASRLDESIPLIAAAQEDDGYIATQVTIPGRDRFETPKIHEVYCMGHLLTAAITHRRMTGKDSFFEIAVRCADYLHSVLGVTVDPAFAHNPSAIMGLVELYRDTGEQKYLDCAKEIVDMRGHNPSQEAGDTGKRMLGSDQIQDRVPLREETEVVGHNVFFT